VEYAKTLPEGLLDRFRLEVLAGCTHVEQNGEAVELTVRLYRHPPNTPTQWKMKVAKDIRQSTPASSF